MTPKNLVTRRALAELLGNCSKRTVQRFEKRYKLVPKTYTGLEPLFDPSDVQKAVKQRIRYIRTLVSKLNRGGAR